MEKKKFSIDIKFLQYIFYLCYLAGAHELIKSEAWLSGWRTATSTLLWITLVLVIITIIVVLGLLQLSYGPYQKKLAEVKEFKPSETNGVTKRIVYTVVDLTFLSGIYFSKEATQFTKFSYLIGSLFITSVIASLIFKKISKVIKGSAK